MLTEADVIRMSRKELAEVMADGHAIEPEALDGSQYRGVSLGLPRIVDKLLWKTFMKTFYRDPDTGQLRGWNVKLKQTGIEGATEPKTRRGKPVTFGHYLVEPAEGRRMPRPWRNGVFLDYRRAGNRFLDVARFMGAPLVAVSSGRVDLLLGWEFVELWRLQIPTRAFWTLRREGPLATVVDPPRRPRLR